MAQAHDNATIAPAAAPVYPPAMAIDPTLDIHAFAAALPERGALLGLDPGTKTIGVAVSDRTRMVASGVETIRRKKFKSDGERLLELVTETEAVGFVIGLPLNMDGSEGPRAQSVHAFARNLAAITDLPLVFWDERLTTAQAERTLLEADTSRKRRAEVIDQLAAAIILQAVLDRLRTLKRRDGS